MKMSMLKEFVKIEDLVDKIDPEPVLATKPKTLDNTNNIGHVVSDDHHVVDDQEDSHDYHTYGLHPVEDEETIRDIDRYKRTQPHLYRKITNLD